MTNISAAPGWGVFEARNSGFCVGVTVRGICGLNTSYSVPTSMKTSNNCMRTSFVSPCVWMSTCLREKLYRWRRYQLGSDTRQNDFSVHASQCVYCCHILARSRTAYQVTCVVQRCQPHQPPLKNLARTSHNRIFLAQAWLTGRIRRHAYSNDQKSWTYHC